MKRNAPRTPSDKPSRREEKPAGRAESGGRSGYGIESLRPYLREQLALKELLRRGAPAEKTPRSRS